MSVYGSVVTVIKLFSSPLRQICQAVAVPASVQFNTAELAVMLFVVRAVGFGQEGGVVNDVLAGSL